MKHLHALAAALLTGPLLPQATLERGWTEEGEQTRLPDRPLYAPRPGEAATFRYVLRAAGELDELTLTIDGRDFIPIIGDLGLEFDSSAIYEVTDVVLESGPDRPRLLRRSFDELHGTGRTTIDTGWSEEHQEIELSSPLQRRRVLFTWNAEAGSYEPEFEEPRQRDPDHLLEELDEDMSVRRLLPRGPSEDEPGPLRPGDTWGIEYPDLLRIAFPGGHLGLAPDETGEFEDEFVEGLITEVTRVLRERVPEWLRGESTATYLEARPEDGDGDGEVALEIGLEVDLELDTDLRKLLDDWAVALLEEQPYGVRSMEFARAELECKLEGDGRLTWSRAAGHLSSFEFTGRHATDLDLAVDVSFNGTTYRIEMIFRTHGTWGSEIEAQ